MFDHWLKFRGMLTAPLSLLRSSLTLGLLESIRTILLRLMGWPLPLKEAGTAEQEEDEEEDDRQAAKYGHQDLKGGSSSSSSRYISRDGRSFRYAYRDAEHAG